MPAFACLVVGTLRLHHNEGVDLDLAVCTVRYVFAKAEEPAKLLALDKVAKDEVFYGEVSHVDLRIEKINRTFWWALLAKEIVYTWDPTNKRKHSIEGRAKRTAIEKHRYIK